MARRAREEAFGLVGCSGGVDVDVDIGVDVDASVTVL